ncbi:MAG TPA: hypothetical protein VGF50_08230 [Caulobacteraceae bacterium]
MDGKIATLVGAAALAATPVIAGAGTIAASGPAVPVAATYAELLSPIPNASERLRIADAQAESGQPRLIETQYVAHHHHHHHQVYHRRYRHLLHRRFRHEVRAHHHHHHHHDTNY